MEVLARRVRIFPHDNADRLEIAQVDDFFCVVGKGQFQTGDLAVYVPEQAIVPEDVVARHDLQLSRGNVVKACRLRGVVSQGVLLPLQRRYIDDGTGHSWEYTWEYPLGGDHALSIQEGQNLAEVLGITKCEVHAPRGSRVYIAGNNVAVPECFRYHYDLENIKRHPDVFTCEDVVTVSEKIHGTLLCVMALDGQYWVSSKGLLQRGGGIDLADTNNLYTKAALKYDLGPTLALASSFAPGKPVMVFAEVFGQGIQDLDYGADDFDVRVFDVRVNGQWVNHEDLVAFAEIGFPLVPLLYIGPFDADLIKALTDGKERVSGGSKHLREGVVVRDIANATHPTIGRKILKSVSTDYLLRKGGTEYN